jgi:hypothetical protein
MTRAKRRDSRQCSTHARSRRGCCEHRDQLGSSLLECAFALALAAMVLISTTRVSQASATLVRRARAVAETVDVARNLLEHELGAPCAAPLPCPFGYRCSVTRSPVTAVADRLTASVSRDDGAAAEELRTLAPALSCGG